MVQSLTVSITSDTSVHVSWRKPAETRVDIIGYEVELRRYAVDDQVISQMRFPLSADASGLPITSLSE